MTISSYSSGTAWRGCGHEGCTASPLRAAGWCLAHTDDDTLQLLMADGRPGQPFDCQGATIEPALFDRMLALAPRDDCNRPTFRSTLFGDATFVGPAPFDRVTFSKDVSFDRATFKDDASFIGAVFEGNARFGGTTFEKRAAFSGAHFTSQAWFSSAEFAGEVDFKEAHFDGPAWFGSTAFSSDVVFERASFRKDTSFDETNFGCHASFAETLFERDVRLTTAAFKNEALYNGAKFKGPSGAPPAAAGEMEWVGAQLASWSSRAQAALIDHAVPGAILAGALVLPAVLSALKYYGTRPYLVVIALAASAAYIVRNLTTQGYTGQTLGKQRLGLTLVRKNDGLPVGVRASLLRYALHIVDTLPAFVGWLAPLWDPSRQTFADRIATTVVACQKGWDGAAPEPRPSGIPATGFG